MGMFDAPTDRDHASHANCECAKDGCICTHAPEQHRPDGCEIYGCECRWAPKRPEGAKTEEKR